MSVRDIHKEFYLSKTSGLQRFLNTHTHTHTHTLTHTHTHDGAGEMAQWLRALAVLLKVLSSISNTHTVAHNHL
jgi:hypothetical protein